MTKTLPRATVKSRLNDWLKTHPNGAYSDWYQEFEYKPFLDGKFLETPFFQSHTFSQDWLAWTEEIEAKGAVWILQPSDGVFINDDIESAVKDRNSKLISKPKGRKSKDWIIEYKWISKDEFNKYPKWFANKVYTDKWQTNSYGNKFVSSTAAMNSLKTRKTSFLGMSNYAGRYWRIRNTKTNQIIEYVPTN